MICCKICSQHVPDMNYKLGSDICYNCEALLKAEKEKKVKSAKTKSIKTKPKRKKIQ